MAADSVDMVTAAKQSQRRGVPRTRSSARAPVTRTFGVGGAVQWCAVRTSARSIDVPPCLALACVNSLRRAA
jgi:hypothetical protein